jgi:PAS domain S-box-containing protein
LNPSSGTYLDSDPLPNSTHAIAVFARGVMVVVTVFCIIMMFVIPANIVRWATIAAICAVTSGASLVLVRQKMPKAASTLLLGGLWAIITVSALSQGGMEAPGIGSFLILILCAGLFCGNAAGIIMGVIVVATELAFVLLGKQGLLPPAATVATPWNLWVRQVFFCSLAVMTQQAATRLLLSAIRRMQKELLEKEAAVEELAEIEKKFETFAAATFEGVAITRDGLLLEINEQFSGMVGFARNEILNKPVLDFVAPESRDLVRERIRSLYEGSYQHLALRKDGSAFPVEIQTRPITYKGKPARATVIRDIADRIARESALKVSEQKYREIIFWAPVGIYRSSADGKLLMANQALVKILGYDSEDQMLGLNTKEDFYVDPADRDKILAQFDAKELGDIIETEVQWKRRDNSRIWVSLTGHASRDPETGETFYEGFVFDVTQRKLATETLRESEERFRTLMENAPLAIDISRDGFTIYSNKMCLEMFGFRGLEQIKAAPISERWSEHDRPIILERMRARREGKTVPTDFEGTGLRQNGSTFPLTASVSRVNLPDGPADIAVLVDNTEQKLAQESLRLRSAALDAAANAILITDTAGTIEWINPAFTTVTGYTFDEAVGKNPRDLLKSDKQDHAFYENQWRTILAGNVWKGHLTNRRKDGSLYEEEMTITPVRGIDDTVRHFIAIKQDVSEQMKRQAALRESEERFRSLFNRMQDGVYQSTHDGKFVDVNAAFAMMFGYSSREEMLSIDIKKELYFAPEERGSHVLDTGKEEVEVYRMRRKDGSEIFVEDHGRYVHDDKGNIVFHEGILRDVTERRRAAMLQEAVYRISESAQTEQKLDDLFRSIHQIVGELMPARNFFIALYDPATDLMSFPYHTDEQDVHWAPMKPGKTLTGYVLRTGTSLLATPELFDELQRRGDVELVGADSKSWLGVPLKTRNGQILGAMVTQSYLDNEKLLPKDKDILAFVSTQVAMALERRNANENLLESEERFRSAMYYSPIGMGLVAPDGKWLDANPALCTIVGYSRDELLESNFQAITHADDLEADLQSVREMLERKRNNYSMEKRYIHKSGRHVWIQLNVSLLWNADGSPRYFISQVQDITMRRKADEALHESEEQFRLISENVADHIVMIDTQARILYSNPSHSVLFGDPAALRGTDAFLEIHPDDRERCRKIFLEGIHAGESRRAEYRIVDKSGGVHSIESQGSPIRDSAGKITGAVIVSRDKTEQDRLEQQMLRMQRLESIGTLASGVAHDLNNVLAPIILALELLRNGSRTDAEIKMLDNLKTTAHRGASIVSQILGFARGMEGERSALHVRQLVKEIARIAEETFPKSIVLQVHLANDVPLIRGDQTQIHQVLLNLCVNARDAMPRGGTLSISLDNHIVDEPYARIHPGVHPGKYILLSVADTGTGIPPEILARIFEPFFTTKERGKGTGLGLSTVHGIVKSHGGFVDVYSEPGSGTTFRVYLPAGELEGTLGPLASKQEVLRGNGEYILVVDDEESILEITKETLGAFGYNVLTASDGAAALAEYGSHKDQIVLVITDMMMPILDGQQTIFALRSMNPSIKIIGCSGLAASGKHPHDSAGDADAFITKPYTAETLLTTIARVLKG